MSQTPVSPAQPATLPSPFLFQAERLKSAIFALSEAVTVGGVDLPDDITKLLAGATDIAVEYRNAVDPTIAAAQNFGHRFTLLGADGQPLTGTIAATQVVAIHDALTGLTWQPASSDRRYTNDGAADEYARSLTTLGFTDWRVPTEPELLTIRDLSTYNPAVLAPFRAGVKPVYHWSSSPDPESAGCARYVSFYYGDSVIASRGVGFHVLACRGGVGAVGGVSPGQ